MRELILDSIRSHLLHDSTVGDFLREYDDPTNRFAAMMRTIRELPDLMLLSLYRRLLRGDKIIVVGPGWNVTDDAIETVYLTINGLAGAMVEDGSIHT
jgi:hypothetical protein